jgi:hypothetical protein
MSSNFRDRRFRNILKNSMLYFPWIVKSIIFVGLKIYSILSIFPRFSLIDKLFNDFNPVKKLS